MKTRSTRAGEASAFSGPASRLPISLDDQTPPMQRERRPRPAMFMSARCQGAARSAARRRVERRRSTAAGAGPSSAIARTSARNEPETRIPRNSIVSTSLPISEDQQEQDELDGSSRAPRSSRRPRRAPRGAARHDPAKMSARRPVTTFTPHRLAFGRSLGETRFAAYWRPTSVQSRLALAALTTVRGRGGTRRATGCAARSAGCSRPTRQRARRQLRHRRAGGSCL